MPNFMKTCIIKIFIASTILISSCNNHTDNNVDKQTETPTFLKKYKWTTLPISMKGCFGNSYNLPLISPDSVEGGIDEDGSLAYCTFKTNGDYYAVIRLGAADCMLPYLITYDGKGQIIDEKELAIGYCGDAPGYRCEEFASISKDFSIFTSDTISVTSLDSLGEEIRGTTESYIIYKKGRLLSSGKIELTDTIRQVLVK